MLVAELERHFLPNDAVFVEALRVNHSFRKIREKVSRREKLAYISACSHWFKPEERSSLPPYLCLVSYGVHRHASEILASLEGRAFEAATEGRSRDICHDRRAQTRQFTHDIVFLGAPKSLGRRIGCDAYRALKKTPDGARILGLVLARGRFKPGCWLFALQPTTEEVAEILERIILIEDRMQELVAIH